MPIETRIEAAIAQAIARGQAGQTPARLADALDVPVDLLT